MASKEKAKFNVNILNNKKIFLYVVLVGLLGFLAFYMLVFKKYEEKTEDLRRQNANLRTEVEDLKKVYDNLDAYRQTIAIMDGYIVTTLSQYPADVREEDALVIAVDTLNKAYVEYSTINIKEKEEVGAIPAETVQKAGLESFQDEIKISKRTVSYVNSTDYINLKTIIGTILSYGGKKTIEQISYSKSEEGEKGFITGTIDVTDFVAEGTGKEYQAPDIKEYEAGLYDLFGIVKNPNKR
ncbi:MAG: hypothetical protein K6G72_00990 [Lachnospiraceae bacterium]|nr:hypothetical protein [Lachnospiraceae bacterium]